MSAAEDDQEPTYTVQYKGEDKIHTTLTKNGWARATFANGDVYEGEYNHGTSRLAVGGCRLAAGWLQFAGYPSGSSLAAVTDCVMVCCDDVL